MPDTRFWKWTYPEDNEEPYFEKEENFKLSVDSATYSLMNTASNIIIPPTSIMWAGGILSWVGQFEIPLMSIGYSVTVPFGPDNINTSVALSDGDRIYAVIPNTASTNIVVQMKKVSGKVPVEEGIITIGYCKNGNFYGNFAQAL